MKKRNMLQKILFLTAIFTITSFAYAQNAKIYNQEYRFRGDYPFKVNLQMTMLDTDYSLKEPGTFNELNMVTIPKLSFEYYMGKNLSFKLSGLLNEIKAGQVVNGQVAYEKFSVFSTDLVALYSLGGLFNIPIVDPYIETGFGYTQFNKDSKAIYNLGAGINIWLLDTGLFRRGQYTTDMLINRFGLNFEVLGQKNLSDGPGSNLQISGGVFFVF